MHTPLILTMGDPTGVGPEIITKAWLDGAFESIGRPLLVAGDAAVLQRATRLFDANSTVIESAGELATHQLRARSRKLAIRALSQLPAEQLIWGQPDTACGRAMVAYIDWACDMCLKGQAAAMVTGPINKQAIFAAGCEAPGHTELLARRCGVEKVVMMLAGTRLKVCLATTHLALKEVPEALNVEEILATIRITDGAFRRFFGCRQPRLAVLALIPTPARVAVSATRKTVSSPPPSRRPALWASTPPDRTAPTRCSISLPGATTTPSSACTMTRA